ncbi:hypothetical protein GCM10023116_03220 [Kistimonas scapharcae]|uniref:Uncharacterized protein n=2 Tax=Kistimonas scapharcae TaxID=1036133 RepID=A0ABP8UVX6_9GAMM
MPSGIDREGHGVYIEKTIPLNQRICRYEGDTVFRYFPEPEKNKFVVFTSVDENFADCIQLSARFVSWLGIYYKPAEALIEIGINGTGAISFINHAPEPEANVRLQANYNEEYIKRSENKVIIDSRKKLKKFLTKIPPYIKAYARKEIAEYTELSCDYTRGKQILLFDENPVIRPTKPIMGTLKHALALDAIPAAPASDSDTSSDSYESDSSDTGDSSDMETGSRVRPEMIDMEKMPPLLRLFNQDIIVVLRDRYERKPLGYLTNILDFISEKSQETDIAEKYKEILKLIAEYNKIDSEKGNKNQLINTTARLTHAERKQASDFLKATNNAFSGYMFHITDEEWDYFINTGEAWDEDQRSRRKRRKTSSKIAC